MVLKQRVYLDTTVPCALLDGRTPERPGMTRTFWDEVLPTYDPVVSTLVIAEIAATPDAGRRRQLLDCVHLWPVLDFDNESGALALEYVRWGIFPEKYVADANHVALAVTNGIAYLASWNYRHRVKVSTRRKVNLVNALQGFGTIEIVAPTEL